MQGGVKLLSKPQKTTLCALICASTKENMLLLAKYSHYVIEEVDGSKVEIYARNDEDFHRKIVKKWMAYYSQSE